MQDMNLRNNYNNLVRKLLIKGNALYSSEISIEKTYSEYWKKMTYHKIARPNQEVINNGGFGNSDGVLDCGFYEDWNGESFHVLNYNFKPRVKFLTDGCDESQESFLDISYLREKVIDLFFAISNQMLDTKTLSEDELDDILNQSNLQDKDVYDLIDMEDSLRTLQQSEARLNGSFSSYLFGLSEIISLLELDYKKKFEKIFSGNKVEEIFSSVDPLYLDDFPGDSTTTQFEALSFKMSQVYEEGLDKKLEDFSNLENKLSSLKQRKYQEIKNCIYHKFSESQEFRKLGEMFIDESAHRRDFGILKLGNSAREVYYNGKWFTNISEKDAKALMYLAQFVDKDKHPTKRDILRECGVKDFTTKTNIRDKILTRDSFNGIIVNYQPDIHGGHYGIKLAL